MTASREKANRLRLILGQEARGGYADKAVIGGLDRLLTGWAEDRDPLVIPPAGYAALTPAKRRAWVSGVLDWLAGERPDPPAIEHVGQAPSPVRGRVGKLKPDVAQPPPAVRVAPSAITLDTPLAAIPKMRADIAVKLAKLDVTTIRDALYFFPRRHIDFSHTAPIAALEPEKEATLVGFVWEAREVRMGPRRRSAEAIIGDETGNIRAIWFNQPYLAAQFKVGMRVALSGRVSVFRGQRQMESPEYEIISQETQEQGLTHTGRLVPVYSLTEGLSGRTVRQLIKRILDSFADRVPELLPDPLVRRHRFPPIVDAIRQAHYPDSLRSFVRARRRLAYEELLALQLWMLRRRRQWQSEPAGPILPELAVMEGFERSLPFRFTDDQRQVLGEIMADLARPEPMSRLLQGDVGSGKTAVAAAALIAAVATGRQGAFMAPTEILAEQHYRSLLRLLGGDPSDPIQQLTPDYLAPLGRPLRVGLLMGSVSSKRKRSLQQEAGAGLVDILIGTHALIQEAVEFQDLGLAVIDEQHRFGTAQRRALRQKGGNPHILVMTATPVPRSLALTLYGDLETSVIREMPPGRQPIGTKVIGPEQRAAAEEFIRLQVAEGRQAFVVCPLIEESEQLQARAATAEYERLSYEVFPELRLGLLHGRMAPQDKEEIMGRFRDRQIDVLVSTTVIEVGIDIPNASVMLVEGGDRFGLSQLHQLRGRVGRGQHQSYCVILNESANPEVAERLQLLERYPDGFRLAEQDFRLRGSGALSGTRQSGLSELRMATLPKDQRLLRQAREDARALLEKDPELHTLRQLVERLRPSEHADLS